MEKVEYKLLLAGCLLLKRKGIWLYTVPDPM